MKVKKLCAVILSFALAVGVISIIPAFAQEGNEPYTTHNLPSTMKIGEAICDLPDHYIYYHNLTPGQIITALHKTTWNLGNVDLTDDNSYVCFGQHAGEGPFEEVDENGTVKYGGMWGFNTFFRPGTLTVQPTYQYFNDDNGPVGDIETIGKPITITVEEPVIQTNAPVTIKQGESIDFTTTLTNTALENKNIADYDDPANWSIYGENNKGFQFDIAATTDIYEGHIPAYRPTVTIIGGQDLVTQSNQDYSHTLNTSETLTFNKPGTVKLKVAYNQIVTCSDCQAILDENYQQTGDYYTYNPEKIITIQVTEDDITPAPTVKYDLPASVKIGDWIPDLPDNKVIFENLKPNTMVSVFACSYEQKYSWGFIPHDGWGDGPVITDEDGKVVVPVFSPLTSFYRPGEYHLQAKYYYVDPDNLWEQNKKYIEVGDPFIFNVEEPIIQVNAPESIQVGETFHLTTELTNTALTNKDTAYYLDENNYIDGELINDEIHNAHEVVYEPSVEILEGKNLVSQSDQDYSNTLKSSETLTFTGTGTVKLKVTYNQFNTCRNQDDSKLYNPEKIITIQVTEDGTTPIPEQPDKTQLEKLVSQNSNLQSSDYTSDSFQAYVEALKQANAVLENPDATQEEIDQAQKNLEDAIKNLKLIENTSQPSKPEDSSNGSSSSSESNPKTGEDNLLIPTVLLLCASGASMIVLLLRKKKEA